MARLDLGGGSRSGTWLWIALPLLAGCGARSDLEAPSEPALAANASMQYGCGGVGQPDIILTIGATCSTGAPTATFYVADPDGSSLHAGATFAVSETGVTSAQREGVPTLVKAVSGTLSFTSYVDMESATGTYDVTFEDGTTAHGTFVAASCPPEWNYPYCGG